MVWFVRRKKSKLAEADRDGLIWALKKYHREFDKAIKHEDADAAGDWKELILEAQKQLKNRFSEDDPYEDDKRWIRFKKVDFTHAEPGDATFGRDERF